VNREQLAHVLRAASKIAGDEDIVVIGSQAILGSFSETDLPVEAVRSVEADLAFRNDPDNAKSDKVDGSIGEGSSFHNLFSYYGQGVSVETAVLPAGWESRVVKYQREDALPSQAVCLDPYDLVISKLVAGREKDREFAVALIREGLLDPAILLERTELLSQPFALIRRVQESVNRCVRKANEHTTQTRPG